MRSIFRFLKNILMWMFKYKLRYLKIDANEIHLYNEKTSSMLTTTTATATTATTSDEDSAIAFGLSHTYIRINVRDTFALRYRLLFTDSCRLDAIKKLIKLYNILAYIRWPMYSVYTDRHPLTLQNANGVSICLCVLFFRADYHRRVTSNEPFWIIHYKKRWKKKPF